jgi:L-seryl-tRNA(Ser) seleniumtransferase
VPTSSKADLYRKLPSVDELLHSPDLAAVISSEGQASVADAARAVLARMRAEIASARLDAAAIDLALSGVLGAIERQVWRSLTYSLRPIINATGVILHTNLGRAPLAASALEHIRDASSGYSNLEFDTDTGGRGKRDVHVDLLFRKLLDAHLGAAAPGCRGEQSSPVQVPAIISTIVVNNNAAAVLLALNTLAEGGKSSSHAENWWRSVDRSASRTSCRSRPPTCAK